GWAHAKLLAKSPLTDGHDSVGRERIVRHVQVERRGAFADARRRVVVRTVAGAGITAIVAAVLALAGAQRNAAEVGADAERDQPVFLARLGPLVERLRVAQLAQGNRLGGGDFRRGQVAHKYRLLAPAGFDRLARCDF